MFARRTVLAVFSLSLLAACGRGGRPPAQAPIRTPQILSAQRAADGALTLSGAASPQAHLRLDGKDVAEAGTDGAWSLSLAAAPQLRTPLFTAMEDGREVAAQDALLLLPGGAGAALLRAGEGTLRLDLPPGGPTQLLALDYDAQGGAVASGLAAAGGDVLLRLDQAAPVSGRAGADGRFSIPLDRALSPGRHQIEASSGVGESRQSILLSAPTAAPSPRATRQDSAWRIDWTTPAGGAQTTLLFDPAR